MKKICHMTSVHMAEDVRIFHKECTSLAKAGYDVYLVAPGESREKNGIHIIGVGRPSGGRLNRMLVFSQKVFQTALAVDADVYHFHDPELLPYGLKLKKRGKTVIFDSHEDTLESILEKSWLPSPLRRAAYHWFKYKQETICRQLDAVISVTPSIVEYFQAINSRTVQITNFPIFIDLPSVSRQRDTLIFAGGISPDWNHHILLQVLEKLPNVRYLLYGSGGQDYLKMLQAMPAWNQVDYFGSIPYSEIPVKLSSAQIGIALTSYSHNSDWKNGTMGNTKIFEEMMMGLPVVCTDYVLWKEFVERHRCGICVNPQSAEEIFSAIVYLLDHPEEASQMGKNGRQAVKEEFNWSTEEKKLLTLYREILNK